MSDEVGGMVMYPNVVVTELVITTLELEGSVTFCPVVDGTTPLGHVEVENQSNNPD